jgi:uncharacterized protein YwgA
MKGRSFTLLALLSANDQLGQPAVHRTTLVKQAFLAETIRPLYRIWLQTFGFFRYYYGPYSEDVFDRLDTLIFSGLVEVTATERRRGKVEARYRISDAGHRLLDQFGPSEITTLAIDLVWALQSLGVEQAGTICKLVYQEAEFARIFAQHNQEGIGPETKVPLPSVTAANNETFTTLATLQELQRRPGADLSATESLPSREIVRLFLLSLALQVPGVQGARGAAA